jgi:hypothetical protein
MIVSTFFQFFTAHDPVRAGSASCGRTSRSGRDAHVALFWPSSTLTADGTLDLVDMIGQAVPPAINRLLGSFA